MNSHELNQRISSFLARKQAEFPELADEGRQESHTAKYATQLLWTR